MNRSLSAAGKLSKNTPTSVMMIGKPHAYNSYMRSLNISWVLSTEVGRKSLQMWMDGEAKEKIVVEKKMKDITLEFDMYYI